MTAYMKPQDRGIYQEQEAQILGDQTNGMGRRAVLGADPRLKQLEAQKHKGAIDRKLMYGRLGMEKTRMEHEIKMGEGRLDLARKGFKMSEKKFDFNIKMQSKAANIAKFGMALNLAMGMGKFAQDMRNQRKQDRNYEMMVLQLKEQKRQNDLMMEQMNA